MLEYKKASGKEEKILYRCLIFSRIKGYDQTKCRFNISMALSRPETFLPPAVARFF